MDTEFTPYLVGGAAALAAFVGSTAGLGIPESFAVFLLRSVAITVAVAAAAFVLLDRGASPLA